MADWANELIAYVREQRRPVWAVVDTVRLGPHSKGDDHRNAAEIETLRQRDPLSVVSDRLTPSERAQAEEWVTHRLNRTLKALGLETAP